MQKKRKNRKVEKKESNFGQKRGKVGEKKNRQI